MLQEEEEWNVECKQAADRAGLDHPGWERWLLEGSFDCHVCSPAGDGYCALLAILYAAILSEVPLTPVCSVHRFLAGGTHGSHSRQ